MVNKLRRKLYKRGSSFETTIPMPMLFGLDPSKKHYVVFTYEELSLGKKPRKENFVRKTGKWVVDFEEGK